MVSKRFARLPRSMAKNQPTTRFVEVCGVGARWKMKNKADRNTLRALPVQAGLAMKCLALWAVFSRCHGSSGGPVGACDGYSHDQYSSQIVMVLIPQFFSQSGVGVSQAPSTHRRRAKSTRRATPSSSPWSICLRKVRSPSPHAQPIHETFALKITNC